MLINKIIIHISDYTEWHFSFKLFVIYLYVISLGFVIAFMVQQNPKLR